MNYEKLILEAPWALKIIEVNDIYFDDTPRYSVMDCDFITGDRNLVSEHLESPSAALLFTGNSFLQRIEVVLAGLAIRPGPRDIEVMSMKPLSELLSEQSSLVAVILPDIASNSSNL